MSYFSRAAVALAIAGSLTGVLASTAVADTNCTNATVCAPVTGPLITGPLLTSPLLNGPLLGGLGLR